MKLLIAGCVNSKEEAIEVEHITKNFVYRNKISEIASKARQNIPTPSNNGDVIMEKKPINNKETDNDKKWQEILNWLEEQKQM